MTVLDVKNFVDGLLQKGVFNPNMDWRHALEIYCEKYDKDKPDEIPPRSETP